VVEVEGTQFFTQPSYVKFICEERLCILHPTEGAFTPVKNQADAFDFLESLLKLLRSIAERRINISPDYREYSPVSPIEILKLLPRTNCRDCWFSCLGFAAALSRQKTIQEIEKKEAQVKILEDS
jgi:ArsR family metal-binding transcriptional regulator